MKSKLPESVIECTRECSLYVGIPIHSIFGTQVLVMSSSLLETMIEFSRLNEIDVALLNPAKKDRPEREARYLGNWQATVPSLTNGNATFQLLAKASTRMPLSAIGQRGVELTLAGKHFMLWSLPVHQKLDPKTANLLLIKDISQQKQVLRNNIKNIALLGISSIILLAALGIFITLAPLRRIRLLSQKLPLLAQHRYQEFRDELKVPNALVHDELDLLSDATTSLSLELEQMQQQIEDKTKQLEQIAMYDALTGLANRSMFLFQLDKSIATLGRTQRLMAIIFLDLDKFKSINDTLGHHYGDELLKIVSHRIKNCVRDMDMVCRLGGDEFTVLLTGLSQVADIELIMEKIAYEMNRPVYLANRNLLVTSSAGVAFADSPKIRSEELLKRADIAMYEAKRLGRNQYVMFSEGMYQQAVRSFAIETEFVEAIEKGELRLHLQPKVSAKDNELEGFEALIRWQHPEQGLILPGEFIPILEDTDHINTLGSWVISHALKLMEMLDEQGFPPLSVAINLSARQFSDPDLLRHLLSTCSKHNIPPKRVELEVTETVMIKDFKTTQQLMRAMKNMSSAWPLMISEPATPRSHT